jgi:hypothetical protein
VPPELENEKEAIVAMPQQKRREQNSCANNCGKAAFMDYVSCYCLECTVVHNKIKNVNGVCTWLVSKGNHKIVEVWESIHIDKIEYSVCNRHTTVKSRQVHFPVHLVVDPSLPPYEFFDLVLHIHNTQRRKKDHNEEADKCIFLCI